MLYTIRTFQAVDVLAPSEPLFHRNLLKFQCKSLKILYACPDYEAQLYTTSQSTAAACTLEEHLICQQLIGHPSTYLCFVYQTNQGQSHLPWKSSPLLFLPRSSLNGNRKAEKKKKEIREKEIEVCHQVQVHRSVQYVQCVPGSGNTGPVIKGKLLLSSYEKLWAVQCGEIGGDLLLGLKLVKLEILSTPFIDFLYDKLGEFRCPTYRFQLLNELA